MNSKLEVELNLPASPLYRSPEAETDRAYMAGLMDGEGCISVDRSGGGRIMIGMTDVEVISWLARFGGYVDARRRQPPRKEMYVWRLHRQACVRAFLEDILPHMKLITKREKAEAVVEGRNGFVPTTEVQGSGERHE